MQLNLEGHSRQLDVMAEMIYSEDTVKAFCG